MDSVYSISDESFGDLGDEDGARELTPISYEYLKES